MAKEKWTVAWDLQSAGAGYEGVTKTKGTSATTLNSEEPIAGNGLRGTVFDAKLVTLEAESAEEAMKFAAEAYGAKGGMAMAAKSTNVEYKSA